MTEVLGEKRGLHFVAILFLILCLGISAGAQADDLFSKVDIKPIKDKRKLPNITLESLKGGKV